MILINIIFLTDDEKHGDDISFHWPAAPGIGEAINLYTGPYQGKYRVIGALWEPTINWTGNVQNMSPNGCSVTLTVRRIGDPKPAPAEDLAKSFVEMSELASRLRQQLINTKTDLTIAREERDEMRKQRDAVMERASLSLTRAEQAERSLAEAQRDTAKWRHDCLKARQENAGYVADAERVAQDCVELSAALAHCQHDLKTMENKVEQAEAALAAKGE